MTRNLRSIIRGFSSINKASTTVSALSRKGDLPSIEELVRPHEENLARRRDMKGMFTSDPTTIQAARSVLSTSDLSGSTQKALNFFEEKIFSQPVRASSEKGSITVKISDIDDFPAFKQQFKASKVKEAMVCVGGPAAEDQVVLSSIVEKIRDKLDEILYITRDYKESNVNHAAKQSHARHGNALNADASLTGHALLPKIIMRALLGISTEEALEPDFRKVDVKFTIDPKKIRIYFANELNWLKQEFKKLSGELTEHDVNRLESLLSQEILNVIEKETGKKISGGVERSLSDSSSVHVTFTKENDDEVRHENQEFRRVGIDAQELRPEEIAFLFDSSEIFSAYKYPGDTHLKFDTHEINRQIAQEQGAQWVEGEEIERVLLFRNEQGEAQLAGLVTKDGRYIYANKLHFTGGYKVKYEYDKDSKTRFQSGSVLRNLINKVEDIFDIQNPLNNETTVSTGVSINALFRKSDKIKAVIERFGSTGEIAVTNSHWTMIAQNNDFVMIRMTGGGNTGSEEYNPAYFLNVVANTRRIFGDDLVGILSTYGCPRSINARNSTEFAKIAEGAIVSYGKGGTGNTKRHAEAAMGLMLLGFDKEVVEYFDRFENRNGELIGKELQKSFEIFKDLKFLHDNVEKTNRRMGYDEKISMEEMIVIAVLIAATTYVLEKVKEKMAKEGDETEAVISSPQASQLSKKQNKEHEA